MSPEARNLIRRYLSEVDRHLPNMSETRRAEMLDEIESYIGDALNDRTGGAEATAADVNAVLAEMDPPESYGRERTVGASGSVTLRKTPTALWVGIVALGLIAIIQLGIGLSKGSFPIVLAAVSAAVLAVGLHYGNKVAYIATVVFVALGVIASTIKSGPATGLGVLIGDSLVLVPVLLSTNYFFRSRLGERSYPES